MNWIFENWKEIGTGLLAVIGGCAVLAKFTPWSWDDKLFGGLIKFLRAIGMAKKKNGE